MLLKTSGSMLRAAGSRGFFTGNLQTTTVATIPPSSIILAFSPWLPTMYGSHCGKLVAECGLLAQPAFLSSGIRFRSSSATLPSLGSQRTVPSGPQNRTVQRDLLLRGSSVPLPTPISQKIAATIEHFFETNCESLILDEEMRAIVSSATLTPYELSLLISLVFSATKNGLVEKELLAQVIVATRKRDLPIADCSKLVWSLAKLNASDRILFNYVTHRVSQATTDDFTPFSLSHMLWAFSRLRIHITALYRLASRMPLEEFDTEELMYFLWAYSKSPRLSPNQRRRMNTKVLQHMSRHLDQLRPYNFGTFIIALNVTKLDYRPFFPAIASYCLSQIPSFTPQTLAELSVFLSSVERFGLEEDHLASLAALWDSLAVRIASDMALFTPRNLCQIHRSLHETRRGPPELMPVLQEKVTGLLSVVDQFDLATMIFELSRSREPLAPSLKASIASLVTPKIERLNPKNLVNVLFSSSKIFHEGPPVDLEWDLPHDNPSSATLTRSRDTPENTLFGELEKGVLIDLPLMSPEMLTTVAHSLSSINRASEGLFLELARQVQKTLPSFSVFLVSDVLMSFLRSRLKYDPLLRSSLALLSSGTKTFPPAHFCALFTTLVELCHDQKDIVDALSQFLTDSFLAKFSASQLISLLWMFCCLEAHDRSPAFRLLLSHLEMTSPDRVQQPLDASLLRWSHAYLAFKDPESANIVARCLPSSWTTSTTSSAPPTHSSSPAIFHSRLSFQETGLASIVQLRKQEIAECFAFMNLSGSVNYLTKEGLPIDVAVEKYKVALFLLSRTALVKDVEENLSYRTATERTCHEILELSGWKIMSMRAQLWKTTPDAEKPEVLKRILAQAASKGSREDLGDSAAVN